MRPRKGFAAIAIAAAAMICIAAALLASARASEKLVLSDEDTGQVYLELPVRDGDRFSVTYTHSVHNTPVTETYEIRGEDIYVVEARFYTFGAGMQTEYPEGVTYSYAEDGAIVLTGYNTLCRDLIYCVSKYYDHTLEYKGEVWSLGEMCGKGTLVQFRIRQDM